MGQRKTGNDVDRSARAPKPKDVPGAQNRPSQHVDKVQLSDSMGQTFHPVEELDLGLTPAHPQVPTSPQQSNPSPPNRKAAKAPDTSPQSPADAKAKSQAGHRSRLRERFLNGGADALPDYELLELVLFRAIPRRDTKDLAKQLLKKFGSFAETINAPSERIREVEGAGDSVVTELKLIHAAAVRMKRDQVIGQPILSTWPAVLDYIRAAQGFENREIFRILFLDKRNHLIADEIQGTGTVDHTPVYIREVVKRALELSATAIILVHNHPSGNPAPSRADIKMTRLVAEAAKPLGITVHDHIIVGREGHASLKELKLL